MKIRYLLHLAICSLFLMQPLWTPTAHAGQDSDSVDIQAYMGYTQTQMEIYGSDDTAYGLAAGFWMGDFVALEYGYQESDSLEIAQASLIGNLYHDYGQRLTWVIGASYNKLVNFKDLDETIAYAGIGYEVTPFKAMTVRAQYLRYDAESWTGETPHGVNLTVLYNF